MLVFKGSVVLCLLATLATVVARSSLADPPPVDLEPKCKTEEATKLLNEGMELQAGLKSEQALKTYDACLKLEKNCVPCLYERGWSLWKLSRWDDVVATWKKALKLEPKHPKIPQFLPTAKENALTPEESPRSAHFRQKTPIGTLSTPEDAHVRMKLFLRIQSYQKNTESPADLFDLDIFSPKSVSFTPDGEHIYVNSLEGEKTIYFEAATGKKLATIEHAFTKKEAGLFDRKKIYDYHLPKSRPRPNEFTGKPVELEFTHGGKFLWVPYYRRSYDKNGATPSAMALIDTEKQQIVRVYGVGPISKYVKASHNGKILAVSHWGDNTVGLWDIRGKNPKKFKRTYLLTVEERLSLKNIKGDRDKNCGFCVRGLAFSPDDKILWVTRMKGGGISAFALRKRGRPKFLGTVFGIVPGPRDIEVTHDGKELLVSCNASGAIAKAPVAAILKALKNKPKGETSVLVDRDQIGAKIVLAGLGARSIRITPDEHYLFVAVNQTSDLVVVDLKEMKVEARIPVDSYPVGVDLSPKGDKVFVTSQGRSSMGGNAVNGYEILYLSKTLAKPRAEPSPSPSVLSEAPASPLKTDRFQHP